MCPSQRLTYTSWLLLATISALSVSAAGEHVSQSWQTASSSARGLTGDGATSKSSSSSDQAASQRLERLHEVPLPAVLEEAKERGAADGTIPRIIHQLLIAPRGQTASEHMAWKASVASRLSPHYAMSCRVRVQRLACISPIGPPSN
jgi:hypothetical protein